VSCLEFPAIFIFLLRAAVKEQGSLCLLHVVF
jgi:hypothetical protein